MGQQKSKIISGEPEATEEKKVEKVEKEVPTLRLKRRRSGSRPAPMPKDRSSDRSVGEGVGKKPKKTKIRSKKYQAAKKKLKIKSTFSIKKAIKLLKEISNTPFDSALEVHIALNLKPKETINLKKIKADPGGVIHLKIGKIKDKTQNLIQEFESYKKQINQTKPSGGKDFIKSIALCTTQSPSIKIKLE